MRAHHLAAIPRKKAFSLVLSLTVMSMLLLLCIGAAATLSIELRVSRATLAQEKARLNARAACGVAMGEIQRLLGPDRAVTANAAILASNNAGLDAGESSETVRRPRYVGVWKGLRDAARLPAVSPLDTYARDHDKAFAGWLASGVETQTGLPLCAPGSDRAGELLAWMKNATDSDTRQTADGEWRLLGGTTPYQGAAALANRDPVALHAKPENFSGAPGDTSGGAFAWVAMDENQKARVDLRRPDAATAGVFDGLQLTAAAAAFHVANAADGASFGLRKTRQTADKTPTLNWAELPLDTDSPGWFPVEKDGATPVRALRHDFTTESYSLLTDTANGGLKRDLGLLALYGETDFDHLRDVGGIGGQIGFEADDNGADNPRAAWWRTAKTKDIPVDRGGGSDLSLDKGARARLWPVWSDVREWATFATTAKDDSGSTFLSASTAPTLRQISYPNLQTYLAQSYAANQPDRTYQTAWRQPVIARYRVEIRLVAQAVAGTTPTQYNLVPRYNASVVLWNPYNVRLQPDQTGGAFLELRAIDFPVRLKLQPIGGALFEPNLKGLNVRVPLTGAVMEPGEFRVFSTPQQTAGNAGALVLNQVGYSPSGGVLITSSGGLPTGVAAGTSIRTEFLLNDKYRTQSATSKGSNSNLTLFYNAANWLGFRGIDDTNLTGMVNAAKLLGAAPRDIPVDQFATPTGMLAGVFEMRLKSERSAGGDDGARALIGDYRGVYQIDAAADASPAFWNPCPMEWVAWDDSYTASPENTSALAADGGKAFGGTGYRASTGLSQYVARQIPLHPPVSLMELNGARLGGGWRPMSWFRQQPYNGGSGACYSPPAEKMDYLTGMNHVRNAFGNSLSNPWVPADGVVSAAVMEAAVAGGGALGKTRFSNQFAYDMSWIMNAAIADSWFVSSLGAWNTGACGKLFGESRTAQTLLHDFLNGAKPLPDARFEPLAGSESATDYLTGNTTVPAAADKPAPYEKLAARLLVKGGFNINSTSVRAWRAFLASAYNKDADGNTVKNADGGTVKMPDATVSVLKAPEPNANPTAQPQSESALRCNGGIALNDTQLDKLARAIVSEVKKRGPFLSVGEFLNRRLETGDLGALGAVQAAIRKAGLEDYLKTTGYAITDLATPNGTEAKTAYDYSGVNNPGWLSQADLLRPLMPAITPRGDTFTVRVAASPPDESSPKVVYEITLRRTYAYLDASDTPETNPSLLKTVNKAFGRRFKVESVTLVPVESL